MKILYLLVLMKFYVSYVLSRSLATDGNKIVILEPKAELQTRLKQKSEDNVTWIKVESNSSRGISTAQDGSNSGHKEKFIFKTSPDLLQHEGKKDSEDKVSASNMTESWVENTKPLTVEHMFTGNDSKKDSNFLDSHSQVINHLNSSDFSDALDNENLSLSALSELESGNFSGFVIFSFEDLKNNDSTVAETLIESVNSIEMFLSNSTLEISEEGNTGLFQEVSTFGFEFLIDSETTRNSLLSELLNSRDILMTEDCNDDLLTLSSDWEQSTLENDFSFDKKIDLNSSLNEETLILTSTKNGIEDLENKMNTSDSNLVGSEKNEISEKITPVCPDPGWCFFWLLAQDTCAEDNHCLGSRICCKLGCSKTCIDV